MGKDRWKWKKAGWVVIGRLALAAACCAISACSGVGAKRSIANRSEAFAKPRNLLLISVDTLRADHLGCYGYPRPTSPEIDAFARGGSLVTTAFAASPHTAPSHMSMFTSQYPFEHGILSQYEGAFRGTASTLAEVLQRAGYDTAAFVGISGPGFHFGPDAGHARGFRIWESPNRFFELDRNIRVWLAAHRDMPFFLFVHAYDLHDPQLVFDGFDANRFDPEYHGPIPGTWGEFLRATNFPLDWPMVLQVLTSGTYAELNPLYAQLVQRYQALLDGAAVGHVQAVYDAQIFYADRGIGRLLGWVKELGLEANTLVVLTADHGQEFGEHGKIAAHGQLYDETLHVPLIFHGPGIPSDRRLDSLVSSLDILPTALDLLGLKIPETARGLSLAPLLVGKKTGEIQEEVFAALGDDTAIRTREWKLIVHGDGSQELYDVRRDPGERDNVVAQQPAAALTLAHRLREQLRQTRTTSAVGDEVLKERLRTDGYW